MDTNELKGIYIGLSIAAGIIFALVAAVAWFVKKRFTAMDRDSDRLTSLCETISAISVRQDGQVSFAKTLIEHQGKLAILEVKVDALHTRFDALLEKLRLL